MRMVNTLSFDGHTVEVTLHGKTKRVPARANYKYGWLTVSGMYGCYRTATTKWPATIMVDHRGEFVNFGRDDRSGRFNKAKAIWFNEE